MIKDIKRALMITLTSPVKPGSIHRFMPEIEFEERIVEALEVFDIMDEAYRRGKELALGNIDSRSLGLGHLISSAYKNAFDSINERPLPGLDAAAIVLSSIDGYSEGIKQNVINGINSFLSRILYKGKPRDAVEFVESLEDLGLSNYINLLERSGITKESIEYEERSLGDVFEILSKIDSGFLLNLKHYSNLLKFSKMLMNSKNVIQAALKSYVYIGKDLFKIEEFSDLDINDPNILSKLLSKDKLLKRNREDLNAILGGVLIILYFSLNNENPLKLF
ncbi:hypothetical protein Calag_0517 [Caldisphaera lagunensis DSM 15908]|uniref:Uncharacterized protein n=1 Tax=Caldisphaera lagunensis (strain DSM 15908 / JCM 11604 / ANMR 0165 / IC-154) TaxID=1056495 RepID=L0A8V4_CALLD|nr:hypothetical protein [Caldisphaera lagunensis]AFZ70281.1 hypothetical protein Calag_0517 [Caldisphaera lagunensis DSM 15908]